MGPRRWLRGSQVTVLLIAVLAGCEDPDVETVQTGFRGTGMVQVYNDDALARAVAATRLPVPIPPVPPGPPALPGTWQNVQVLGDISPAEMTRTMVAITQWVSPVEGCAYCHVAGNLASDSLYPKRVSRQMLRMTRNINANWTGHVGQTGVTCWTCHRGQQVPANIWFVTDRNQELRHYLDREDVRVQSNTYVPSNANRSSIKQTEYTYALMIDMSKSLGVNCTYCHNSARFGSWEESPPQRLTALRGIRMTRELNNEYLLPLTAVFPEHRLGPLGDVAKIQCATCHQGAYKPLYGASITAQYPAMYWQGRPDGRAPVDPAVSPLVVPTDSATGAAPVSPVVRLLPAAPHRTSAEVATAARP